MLLLLLPIIQNKIKLFDFRPLDDVAIITNPPKFSIKNYFDCKYQDSLNLYIEDNIGFRPFLIRSINQFKYKLFNTTNAPGVVIGKSGNFFIESYILDHIGADFVGDSVIKENVRKIKIVQDSLKRLKNIDLIIVFAPGKASYFPEDIPDSYLSKAKPTNNYHSYVSEFKNAGVKFMDIHNYFLVNKEKFKYPIYPKNGTHWSSYGVGLATDSLIKYIEKVRGIRLPSFDYSEINFSDSVRYSDYDIGQMMNLLWQIPQKPMPYPVFRYYKDASRTKPKVLSVSDSYWWCLVGQDIPENIFDSDTYWFYNREVILNNVKQSYEVKDLDFKAEIDKQDVIVMMATEATLALFPYGFIDNVIKTYHLMPNEAGETFAGRVKKYENNIRTSPEWLKSVEEKASNNNVAIDAQIHKDAVWLAEQDTINK